MATVYKIQIKTVSAFVSYQPIDVEIIIKKLIEGYKDPNTQCGFESTVVYASKEQ